jgi:DNA-binding MarR family transcriptional regulator
VLLTAHATLLERIESVLAPPACRASLARRAGSWKGGGRLRMIELARRVVLSKSNLSRLADRLEDAGLIERQDCPQDRRGYDLLLTRAGRAMRKKMWPVYEARIKELFSSHLSVEEARVIGEALARAVKAARDGKIPA